MKIMFGGGLFGKEALCYQGREIVKQLSKDHKISIDCAEVSGYWEKFHNNFKGPEDIYVMNCHSPFLPKIAEKHKNIIAIVVFETLLPKDWVDAINIPEVKQVWTISEFCKEMMIESGVQKDIKVTYIGVDDRFCKENISLFPRDNSFKFLNTSAPHCLDVRDRKGLDILIPAFKEEFQDSTEVTLVLKINTIYADKYNNQFGQVFNIYDYVKDLIPEGMTCNNICILTNYMNFETLNALYNSVDCGVYSHRAEGFGLPIAEMMKLSKPVISTAYSATTEFSDPILQCKITALLPLKKPYYPYNNGLFAEPNKAHLRELMRKVYKEYSIHSKRAIGLSKTMQKFTWSAVSDRMNKFLKEIKK